VWTLIVLAALIALVSSLTVWVKRQALDTDAWVSTSSTVLENDQVRQALSAYVVDQLYENGDVSARLEQRLPPDLAGLAGPLAGALREPAVTAVDRLLDRPRAVQVWERVNRAAHKQLLAILEGNPRANVSTSGGEVVLDLRGFIVQVGTELGVGEQLNQRLPADVGKVTVMKSDQLKSAQNTVKVIKALSWLLGFLTLLLWAVALWLARGWRRAALRGIGASLLIVGILLLVIRRVAGDYVVNALATGGETRGAAHSTWLIATTLLAQIGWASIIYSLVILIGVWVTGPSRVATAARARSAPVMVDHPGIAWTGAGIVYLLLVWWGPTPALRTPLGVIVLGVLSAVGFELIRRVVVAEHQAEVVSSGVPSQPSPVAGH
jgi:hypothetical protein